jgi:hypothetical protein
LTVPVSASSGDSRGDPDVFDHVAQPADRDLEVVMAHGWITTLEEPNP